jgi:FKBP-type peptidyl-prolyl cis-trans isomerase SlyD
VSTEAIAAGKVVSIHYTLSNDAGEELDSSRGNDPLVYLHGAQNILPGLEEKLEGKQIGQKFDAVIPPEKGYGPRRSAGPQTLPRNALPADAPIEPGMQVTAEDDAGQQMPLWIVDIDDESITIDTDHPLAGETLHFAVEILEVREATDQERDHGHVHGDGDHHHHHH